MSEHPKVCTEPSSGADAASVEGGQKAYETQGLPAPFDVAAYALLGLQATFLSDVEAVRIANVNRVSAIDRKSVV